MPASQTGWTVAMVNELARAGGGKLSPSTARADRYIKRREYQRRGVPECWIVDSATPLVERWHPGDEEPEVLLTSLMWQPQADHAPLIIDLEAYFAAVNR